MNFIFLKLFSALFKTVLITFKTVLNISETVIYTSKTVLNQINAEFYFFREEECIFLPTSLIKTVPNHCF